MKYSEDLPCPRGRKKSKTDTGTGAGTLQWRKGDPSIVEGRRLETQWRVRATRGVERTAHVVSERPNSWVHQEEVQDESMTASKNTDDSFVVLESADSVVFQERGPPTPDLVPQPVSTRGRRRDPLKNRKRSETTGGSSSGAVRTGHRRREGSNGDRSVSVETHTTLVRGKQRENVPGDPPVNPRGVH